MLTKRIARKTVILWAVLLFSIVSLPKQSFAASYPEVFDPRINGTTTPVKKQIRNTCWAYASVTAMEQNYVNSTGIAVDLSPNYFNYLLAANITGTFDWTLGVEGILDSGLSAMPVIKKAMAWQGPVLQTTFPDSITGYQQVSILENRPAALHVQGFTVLPELSNYKTNTADEITDRVNKIKNLVYQHGNVISRRDGLGSYHGDHYSQNLLPDRVGEPNHVVTIVGWDDGFDLNKFTYRPSRNGAFIAKNSWGEEWGDGGYYYISYEDAYLRAKELYSFTSVENVNNYKTRYGEGWMDTGSQLSTTNSIVVAHEFDAPKQAEKVDAVSIYTLVEDVSYEIYVNPTGGPQNGLEGFIKVKTGTKTDIGAETIKLDQSIPIISSDQFTVAIKYIKPDNLDTITIPTDRGVIDGINNFRGYTLNANQTWRKQEDNYLFHVYTNSNEPTRIGIIKEVFPDPVFAAEIARQLGKTVEDYLTNEEADKITSVTLNGYQNKAIDDATGVQYLNNLKYLTIQQGNLQNIDLRNNKKLQRLEISGTQLASIDLSGHGDLYWFDATESKLTSVNVKNCPKLEVLQLANNLLTSIDVSTNPLLTTLDLYWNRLESIDVSKNSELTELYLGMNRPPVR